MKVGDVLVVKLRKCTAFSFEEMMLCIQAPDSWCYHTNIRECHNSKNNIRRVVLLIQKTHFYIALSFVSFGLLLLFLLLLFTWRITTSRLRSISSHRYRALALITSYICR